VEEEVNCKLDVAGVEDETLADVEDKTFEDDDEDKEEDPALDGLARTLELDAIGLLEEDAIAELVAAADEALEVEFGPDAKKATTKSEGADEGGPNWFLKWQVPADVPSKVKPTQPSVTSQMIIQAVKPPPCIIVLLKVPMFVSEEQYTSYATTFSSM
jgi:hypothetical protein